MNSYKVVVITDLTQKTMIIFADDVFSATQKAKIRFATYGEILPIIGYSVQSI